jgi:hypothetical protein
VHSQWKSCGVLCEREVVKFEVHSVSLKQCCAVITICVLRVVNVTVLLRGKSENTTASSENSVASRQTSCGR